VAVVHLSYLSWASARGNVKRQWTEASDTPLPVAMRSRRKRSVAASHRTKARLSSGRLKLAARRTEEIQKK